ncbi:hypothetical protein BKA91DRAFT_132364 [Yarrowia lipolytica]|nr:hypothetical protein BKA91DRAFT_132364 [Yarrowia lipolytica]KAE8171799.1 hypothetical protein BKA90DRAFT_138490 [Yarrowia lipolytica]RMI98542.1 hypothetical protein BD777DRAFT_124655 [Yarrowia lipolytica]
MCMSHHISALGPYPTSSYVRHLLHLSGMQHGWSGGTTIMGALFGTELIVEMLNRRFSVVFCCAVLCCIWTVVHPIPCLFVWSDR